MMTGWPRISESFGPTIRATRSLPPPPAKPTTMRTGWSDTVCADAAPARTAAASRPVNN
jgi:hypothetical protein